MLSAPTVVAPVTQQCSSSAQETSVAPDVPGGRGPTVCQVPSGSRVTATAPDGPLATARQRPLGPQVTAVMSVVPAMGGGPAHTRPPSLVTRATPSMPSAVVVSPTATQWVASRHEIDDR